MRHTKLLMLIGVAGAAICSQAQAGGFYIQEQSVRGAGRAYSGEAADQGVESLWWNPAAIARSGGEAYLGAHGIIVDGQLTDTGSTITYPGGAVAPVRGAPRAYKPITPGLVPNFAVALPINDRITLGFAAGAPFNFTTQYDVNSFARYDALTSTLRTVNLQPTIAVRVTDWLDVGVSADAQYTQARLSNAYPNLSPLLPDATSSLRGEGWDWGWTAGAQLHFGKMTIGGSYRSKIDHDLSGTATVSGLLPPLPTALNGKASARATFSTPWIATLGVRVPVTDKLTFNGQVQRLGWGEFKSINVSTATGPQVFAQDYHDTTTGAVGVDYVVTPALTLRAGAQYDPTPTPDVGRTARVPDSDRWLFGAGATANATDKLKIEAAFAYIKFKDGSVNHTQTFYGGTPAATSSHLVGNMEGAGYVLSLGVRSSF